MGTLADKKAKEAIAARSKAKGYKPTTAAINNTLQRNKAHTAEVKARAAKVVAPPPASPTSAPHDGRYVPPTVTMPGTENMPKLSTAPKVPAKTAARTMKSDALDKRAIAARAKAKGLKPTKANVEATYKRNRFRVNHPKPKG